MKYVIKYYLATLLRCFLKLGHLLPLNKKVILMNSFNGEQYSDSPRYLSDYISSVCPGKYRIIWSVCEPKKLKQYESDYRFFIKMRGIVFYWYALTAKVIVINDGWPSFLPKRTGQEIINTWHGFCYKGFESGEDTGRYVETYKKLYRNAATIYLSPAQFFTDTFLDFYQFKGEVMDTGLPRNDILFRCDNDVIQKVKDHLGIGDRKIILYAPTYRSNSFFPDLNLNLQKVRGIIADTLADDWEEWVVVYRLHRLLIERYSDEINNTGCIDGSSYEDMQELMMASDVMITDYSSCSWDFGLMQKPCFLYVEDIKDYEKDPGLTIDFNELPFPSADNSDEFYRKIREFDFEDYRNRLKEYYRKMGSFEMGTACKQVFEKIEEICC